MDWTPAVVSIICALVCLFAFWMTHRSLERSYEAERHFRDERRRDMAWMALQGVGEHDARKAMEVRELERLERL